MANYLRYTFQNSGDDSTVDAMADVDTAKSKYDFSDIDFTGLSPEWTLEDSNKTLVLKVPFTDAQAHTDMKTFHTNMMNNWVITSVDSSRFLLDVSNSYVINDSEI